MGPLHTWAIDSVVRLKPPDPAGRQYLVVCVDVFSKWLEYGILGELSSGAVTYWFHENITCRFGVPFSVHCDNGLEYRGDFAKYCEDLGIRRSPVSVNHPQANGLVERYNGCLKSGFRRLKVACPEGNWYDFIADVAAGLRMLPGTVGVSPYLVVFKQEPHWPISNPAKLVAPEATLEEQEDMVEQ